MNNIKKNQLFYELSTQESTQINGGFTTQQLLGAALGASSSAWWSRNFWGAVSLGNIGGALAVTDRYIAGLLGTIRRFGF